MALAWKRRILRGTPTTMCRQAAWRAPYAAGHPSDALRALALVRSTDPLRGDADRMTETIQRALIAQIPAQP